MIFHETKIEGAYLITPERLQDERGFFARTWGASDFQERGLASSLAQCSISFNRKKGTLRGLHFQVAPAEQPKLVRCTMGAIYDVIVDVRAESATFRQWLAVELTEDNRQMLFIPQGFAHGFQTLCDDTEVFYQMGASFAPEHQRGFRWNDPSFGVAWPLGVTVISDRDANYPNCELQPWR